MQFYCIQTIFKGLLQLAEKMGEGDPLFRKTLSMLY